MRVSPELALSSVVSAIDSAWAPMGHLQSRVSPLTGVGRREVPAGRIQRACDNLDPQGVRTADQAKVARIVLAARPACASYSLLIKQFRIAGRRTLELESPGA